jgi:hypothetical protein
VGPAVPVFRASRQWALALTGGASGISVRVGIGVHPGENSSHETS